MAHRGRLALSALALTLACRGAPVQQVASAQAPAPPPPSASASVRPPPGLAPLDAAAPLVPLPVPGFRDAVVSVPTGATGPRPVVVALHGNFDRPEWQCDVMRGITHAHPFVLCPRGIPRTDAPKSWDRWEYGALKQVREELDAGLEAMRARFAGYVADGPVVFTGFSLGAILGRAIVRDDPGRFPRGLFTEGGHDGWDFKRFQAGGGQRLIFACAQAGCVQAARAQKKQAARQGVELRVADGGNVGHSYDGSVAVVIEAEWAWLVDGDPRWTQRQGEPR
jgi:hypothetical protein